MLKLKPPLTLTGIAGILRFQYSFEACWKAAKQYLYDVEGLDIGSPKGVIRSFREIGIFSEDETILGLEMVNDRNLTVKTYNEDLAIEIFGKLKRYYQLMHEWMDLLSNKA